jgi:CelD/BcsL family acetyltransferase involved in cellulose biosynthesis
MSITSLTIERIDSQNSISELSDIWNRLANGNVMRSHAWASAWWNNFGARKKPFILLSRSNDQIVGILPFASEATLIRGKTLELIGSGKACGDNLGMLAEVGSENEVAQNFVQYLYGREGRDDWDFIELDGWQPQDATSAAMINAFQARSEFHSEKKETPSVWTVTLPKTWDEYQCRLSSKMRKTLQQLDKTYLSCRRAVLDVAQTFEQAKQKLRLTSDFHQSRWKSRSIDGCFGTDGFSGFVDELLERWWHEGIAYVATIKLDGCDAAGVFGFWSRDTLNVYLVGMDITVKKARPGWMLNIESLKHAIDKNFPYCSFLRGDEEYKAMLGCVPIEQQRLIISSPRWIPRLRRSAIERGIEIRDWLKTRRSRLPKQAAS